MAKQSEYLHTLIKSLAKSEKRYVTMWLQRHSSGKNISLTLFEYLDKQEFYDVDDLRLSFRGEAFLNQLAISKQRLIDQIELALFYFSQDKDPRNRVLILLQQVDRLFSLTLYQESLQCLKKLEKHIEKHGLYKFLDDVILYRVKLAAILGDSVVGDIQQINKVYTSYINKQHNYFSVYNPSSNHLNSLLKNNQYEEARDYLKDCIKQHKKKEELLSDWGNLAFVYQQLGTAFDVKCCLREINLLQNAKDTKDWSLRWNVTYLSALLVMLDIDSSWDSIEVVYTKVKSFLKENESKIPLQRLIFLVLKTNTLLVRNGSYKEAAHLVMLALSQYELKQNKMLFYNVLMQNCYLHMLQGKWDLLGSELKSVTRYFKIDDFEDGIVIVQFLSRLRTKLMKGKFYNDFIKQNKEILQLMMKHFPYLEFYPDKLLNHIINVA